MERPVETRVGNKRSRRVGLLFALALACTFAFLLAIPVANIWAAWRPTTEVELRELTVREIVAAEALESDLVVLEAVGEQVLVPVFVSPEDGMAIRAAQAGQGSALTLVERTVIGFGAEVRAALLDPGGSPGGIVLVERQGDQIPIEMPPGAAIATALSAGQPILVTPQALEATGLDQDDLRRLTDAHATPQDDRPTFRL